MYTGDLLLQLAFAGFYETVCGDFALVSALSLCILVFARAPFYSVTAAPPREPNIPLPTIVLGFLDQPNLREFSIQNIHRAPSIEESTKANSPCDSLRS